MAGKNVQVDVELWTNGTHLALPPTLPPTFPGSRQDRAYAEGRETAKNGGAVGSNPHLFGSPEFQGWANGFNAYAWGGAQYQTSVPDA